MNLLSVYLLSNGEEKERRSVESMRLKIDKANKNLQSQNAENRMCVYIKTKLVRSYVYNRNQRLNTTNSHVGFSWAAINRTRSFYSL